MSVYVDELLDVRIFIKPGSKWRWPLACHLWADSAEELYAFAKQLGLKKEWLHNSRVVPHYDLTPNKSIQAIKLGAIQSSLRNYLAARKKALDADK